MNSLFVLLGVESWKPALTALLLPPVPFLVAVLLGARLLARRRSLGWTVIMLSVAGLWLSNCLATGQWLARVALHPPAAVSAQRLAELKAAAQAGQRIAIVVLGGGAEPLAPEYGVSNLMPASIERLRYGVWLGRQTGLPVAFSGGAGWGQHRDTREAQAAEPVAAQEFGRPLRWVEDRSRDTRENAALSVALFKGAGIQHVLVVTHDWHMRRALRAFQRSAAGSLRIEAAPVGLATGLETNTLDWLPSGGGALHVRRVLHEMAGLLMGA